MKKSLLVVLAFALSVSALQAESIKVVINPEYGHETMTRTFEYPQEMREEYGAPRSNGTDYTSVPAGLNLAAGRGRWQVGVGVRHSATRSTTWFFDDGTARESGAVPREERGSVTSVEAFGRYFFGQHVFVIAGVEATRTFERLEGNSLAFDFNERGIGISMVPYRSDLTSLYIGPIIGAGVQKSFGRVHLRGTATWYPALHRSASVASSWDGEKSPTETASTTGSGIGIKGVVAVRVARQLDLYAVGHHKRYHDGGISQFEDDIAVPETRTFTRIGVGLGFRL